MDLCIISFNLMQLKQFCNIATKVSSRKRAATFGDLPDCLPEWAIFSMHISSALQHAVGSQRSWNSGTPRYIMFCHLDRLLAEKEEIWWMNKYLAVLLFRSPLIYMHINKICLLSLCVCVGYNATNGYILWESFHRNPLRPSDAYRCQ